MVNAMQVYIESKMKDGISTIQLVSKRGSESLQETQKRAEKYVDLNASIRDLAGILSQSVRVAA